MGNLATAAAKSTKDAAGVSVVVSAINVLSDALTAGNAGRPSRIPIGIDLSLTLTGLAWRLPSGVVCTQSIRTKSSTPYTHRMQTRRLALIADTVCKLIGEAAPYHDGDVMIESPAYGALGRSIDIAQLHGAVRYGLVRQHGIFPQYAEALSVRRIVLGVGCKKSDAEEKVRKAFHLEFPTPDECDAYLIMRAAEMAATDNPLQLLPDVAYLMKRLRARNG